MNKIGYLLDDKMKKIEDAQQQEKPKKGEKSFYKI
jgi:hypothetical protein